MRRSVLVIMLLTASAVTLCAQEPTSGFEVRTLAGASVPAGAFRDEFRGAPLGVAEVAVPLRPGLRAVGGLSWIAGESRFPADRNEVNVIQLDVGIETGWAQPIGRGWRHRPFVAAGVGGRIYDYRSKSLGTDGAPLAYVAAGTELRLDRASVRLEARDHLVRFRAPTPGASADLRTDVGLALGLGFHFR